MKVCTVYAKARIFNYGSNITEIKRLMCRTPFGNNALSLACVINLNTEGPASRGSCPRTQPHRCWQNKNNGDYDFCHNRAALVYADMSRPTHEYQSPSIPGVGLALCQVKLQIHFRVRRNIWVCMYVYTLSVYGGRVGGCGGGRGDDCDAHLIVANTRNMTGIQAAFPPHYHQAHRAQL